MSKARVAGVGMVPFIKPDRSEDWDVSAKQAVRLALDDASIDYGQVTQSAEPLPIAEGRAK